MKKYLMMALAALAIVSCSKSDDVYNPNAKQEKIQAEYSAAFKKYVGCEISPNQTWGFGKMSSVSAITRADDSNANMFGDSYYVPTALTPAQKTIVMDWFTANANPEGVSVNFDNFFAQNVGASANGVAHMNYMTVGENDEHIANLNAGSQGTKTVFGGQLKGSPTDDFNNRKVYYNDQITHVISTSTTRFGYHNSNDSETYYDYVIIPGYRIDESVADRYFVAFDYKQLKDDGTEIIQLDKVYNDWVVAITPGFYKGNARVIAEDLSATEDGDFDFNDVVFDVNFTSTTTADCVLLAAGGTLPLRINGDNNLEVHKLFGVDTNVMVNTGIKTRPYVKFSVTGSFNYDAKNIKVEVQKNGEWIELKADQGYAPGKIQVTKYYTWCPEFEDIKNKYPLFTDWVANPNKYDFQNNKTWY